jgi:hypothetical protein
VLSQQTHSLVLLFLHESIYGVFSGHSSIYYSHIATKGFQNDDIMTLWVVRFRVYTLTTPYGPCGRQIFYNPVRVFKLQAITTASPLHIQASQMHSLDLDYPFLHFRTNSSSPNPW